MTTTAPDAPVTTAAPDAPAAPADAPPVTPDAPAAAAAPDALDANIPDLASIAHPAPGADPVGAHAFFVGPDGVEAWLDTSGDQPVGYLRDVARPYRAVRIDDPHAWAQVVDHLGLHEDPVPTLPTPAPTQPSEQDTPPADDAPAATDAAQTDPALAGEGKSVGGKFDAAKHPRDKHGRFMHIGDSVDLGGAGHGKITGTTSDGKLTVRKASGGTVKVDPKSVAKVGGGAPNAPSGTRTPSAPGGGDKPSVPGGGKPGGGGAPSAPQVSPGTPGQGGGRTGAAAAAVDAVYAGNGQGGPVGASDSGSGGAHAGASDDELSKAMQSAAPGPEFDALYEEATHRADGYASDLLGSLGKIEPGVTSTLTGMADKYGGRMEGLDFRLKAQDSLTRKIRDKSLVSGKPMDTVTGKIGDALRYTMILDENHYAEGTSAALRDFEAQGMTIVDQDNSWHPGNVYQGVNSVIRTPDGFQFELQFHTQSSFDAKMSTHHDYELARDPKATLADRLAAWDRMSVLQSKVPVPSNVGSVGNQRVYSPPSAPATAPVSPAAAVKSLYDTMESQRRGGRR